MRAIELLESLGKPKTKEGREMEARFEKAVALSAALGQPLLGVSGILNAKWLEEQGYIWNSETWEWACAANENVIR
jgi:hypothetical protein